MLKVKEIFGKVIRSKILKIIILIYILNAIFIVGRGYYDKMIEEKNKLENYEIKENIIVHLLDLRTKNYSLITFDLNTLAINDFTGDYYKYSDNNTISNNIHNTQDDLYNFKIRTHKKRLESYLIPFFWTKIPDGQDFIITDNKNGKYKIIYLGFTNDNHYLIGDILGYVFKQ